MKAAKAGAVEVKGGRGGVIGGGERRRRLESKKRKRKKEGKLVTTEGAPLVSGQRKMEKRLPARDEAIALLAKVVQRAEKSLKWQDPKFHQ